MEIKNEIWILADDRPGTVSQAIGLAQAIGLEYKTIQLKYSFWARLPNFGNLREIRCCDTGKVRNRNRYHA